MNARLAMVAAGILGGTGVVLGAFGAHELRPYLLQVGMLDAWETGVRYHLVHAVAILALAGWMRGAEPAGLKRSIWALRLWIVGTVLFSGSLYILALGGPRWVGPVTPAGGLALIGGWVMVAAASVG